MILESLNMRRHGYGPNEGKLVGEILFKNPTGQVQLILEDEKCLEILGVCADALVEHAQEVANKLTAEIMSATPPLIEGPKPSSKLDDDGIPF